MARSLTVLPQIPQVPLAGATRRACFRRFRRHRPPGPARTTPGLRRLRTVRVLRACPDRRRLRSRRRTSGDQGPGRPVPPPRGPAVRQVRRVSVQVAPQAGLTSRPRDLVAARPPRGPRVLARPGQVHPGQADRAPAPVARVLALGQAITRSARPRPAWGQRLRPGHRRLERPVSPLIRAVLDSRRARRVPQLVLAVPVRPVAVRAALVVLVVPVLVALVRADLGRVR
jgi:hypothetical protein